MCILRLVLAISLNKAQTKYYKFLENTILAMSNRDPAKVEKNKKDRAAKNIQEKRQEKGLITVIESVNETEANRTSQKDSKHEGDDRFKNKFGVRDKDVIAEGENEELEEGVMTGSDLKILPDSIISQEAQPSLRGRSGSIRNGNTNNAGFYTRQV